jgi:hypothetical protein
MTILRHTTSIPGRPTIVEWNKVETPGTSMDESFTREEIAIPVKCNLHPWMHRYIAVFKDPFFAVTGKDGTFDLSSLPPAPTPSKRGTKNKGRPRRRLRLVQTKGDQFRFQRNVIRLNASQES